MVAVYSDVLMPTSKHPVAVSLPDEEYAQLSAIAQQSRVSMAWLVHQAVIEFFARHHGERSPSPLALRKAQGIGQ